MKRKPYNRATSIIQAFERGRADAKRGRSVNHVPYLDRAMAESWERGVRYELERTRRQF